LSNESKQDREPFDRKVVEELIMMLDAWAKYHLVRMPRDPELSSAVQALLDAYDRLAAESKAQAEQPPQPAPATAAELDSLRSSLAILTCRVAALESVRIQGPSVPASPWQPYPPFGPDRPLITYGTRTSDKIEERA
jgi:hypothetical protein